MSRNLIHPFLSAFNLVQAFQMGFLQFLHLHSILGTTSKRISKQYLDHTALFKHLQGHIGAWRTSSDSFSGHPFRAWQHQARVLHSSQAGPKLLARYAFTLLTETFGHLVSPAWDCLFLLGHPSDRWRLTSGVTFCKTIPSNQPSKKLLLFPLITGNTLSLPHGTYHMKLWTVTHMCVHAFIFIVVNYKLWQHLIQASQHLGSRLFYFRKSVSKRSPHIPLSSFLQCLIIILSKLHLSRRMLSLFIFVMSGVLEELFGLSMNHKAIIRPTFHPKFLSYTLEPHHFNEAQSITQLLNAMNSPKHTEWR